MMKFSKISGSIASVMIRTWRKGALLGSRIFAKALLGSIVGCPDIPLGKRVHLTHLVLSIFSIPYQRMELWGVSFDSS